MACRFLLLQRLKKLTPAILHISSRAITSSHSVPFSRVDLFPCHKTVKSLHPWEYLGAARSMAYGQVNLVLSDGKPKFETHEIEPPKKRKWLTKKRLKLQRKREKRKRKEANRNDPRRIRPKGKKIKQRFPTAEARIKYKIEKAKLKEALLVEKLKKYEVSQIQGPMLKPEELTGEERFYVKKMAQKKSNYVPVGRRGIFGGVILNMHLHWKKHETVKVICKPCKPGQVHEYAKEIARLSGGVPIQIIGNDTIVFFRGKNYVQPEVMSPIDTLSKKKALEKSKYEQSLETVRRFIAISEKELELYYRHVALYGDPQSRNADLVYGDDKESPASVKVEGSHLQEEERVCSTISGVSRDILHDETICSTDYDTSEDLFDSEVGSDDELDSNDEELTKAEVDSEGEEVSDPEEDSEDEANACKVPN
ncbi:uncharacterized protein [Typha angustifolia]|uniref:uncharacterized protein isoform X1 n=1 Tax=Typha angustifolia TaxID=59011 RepID=UPI003C2F2AE1